MSERYPQWRVDLFKNRPKTERSQRAPGVVRGLDDPIVAEGRSIAENDALQAERTFGRPIEDAQTLGRVLDRRARDGMAYDAALADIQGAEEGVRAGNYVGAETHLRRALQHLRSLYPSVTVVDLDAQPRPDQGAGR